MTRRRQRPTWSRLAGAAAAAALSWSALATGAAPAGAAGAGVSNLRSGYWWQPETAGAQVPPPPNVGAGALWVSSTSSGPQSVSAVRFSLGGASAPVLTLKVSQAQPSGQLSIVACPTATDWAAPSGPGVWADRPVEDCGHGQAVGRVDANTTQVTFDLSALVSGTGELNVVLLPASTADPSGGAVPVTSPAPVYPTFSATFDPLTTSNISTTPEPAIGTTPSADAGPAFADQNPPPPALPAPIAGDSGNAAAIAALVNPVATAQPVPALASPSSATAPTFPSVLHPLSPAVLRGVLPHRRSWRQRVVLSLLLIDMAGYMIWSASRPGAGLLPRLTLYDVPALVRRPVTRDGTPPPLR